VNKKVGIYLERAERLKERLDRRRASREERGRTSKRGGERADSISKDRTSSPATSGSVGGMASGSTHYLFIYTYLSQLEYDNTNVWSIDPGGWQGGGLGWRIGLGSLAFLVR